MGLAQTLSWSYFSTQVRVHLPDIVLGMIYLIGSTAALLLTSLGPLGRAMVGLPLLVFLPGYGILAALFPEQSGSATAVNDTARSRALGNGHLDMIERVVLSFGLSVALIPLVGLALGGMGVDLSLRPVVGAFVAIAALGLIVGAFRRIQVPEDRRFRVPVRQWYENARHSVVGTQSPVDGVLNVALAMAIVVALGLLCYGVLGATVTETDSSMALLTASDDGGMVAGGYPANLSTDEEAQITAAVHNGEGEEVTYTVVVALQRVDTSGDGTTVTESQEITRLQQSVGANETWHANHTVSPELTGRNLRLTYYLYEGDAPSTPSMGSAYRHTYIWVNVSSA